MQENLLAAGAPPRASLGGAYCAPHTHYIAGVEGAGCPLSKTLPPLSALWASPLTRNWRFGPSQNDGLDPAMHVLHCCSDPLK